MDEMISMCGLACHCAHCPDYVCDKLEGFFKMAPDNRTRLDAIRAALCRHLLCVVMAISFHDGARLMPYHSRLGRHRRSTTPVV